MSQREKFGALEINEDLFKFSSSLGVLNIDEATLKSRK